MRVHWTKVEVENDSVIPKARSSHDLSCIHDKLYLWGGEHEPRTPIDSKIYCFDIIRKNWNEVEATGQPPSPRIAHAQGVIGDCIWIFGGRDSITMNEAPMNDMHVFNTSTSNWTSIDADSRPPARSFHKMISIGATLYIFGGCGAEGRLADLYAFDTLTNTYTLLACPPECCSGRGGPSIGANSAGSKIILSTGYSGQENDDAYIYHVASNTWEISLLPGSRAFRARSVCASSVIGDHFIIAGGEVSTSDKGHEGAGDFASDVVVLDSHTGQPCSFEMSAARPSPARGWTAMAALKDGKSALLFGGLAGNDDAPLRLNDMWLLTLVDGSL